MRVRDSETGEFFVPKPRVLGFHAGSELGVTQLLGEWGCRGCVGQAVVVVAVYGLFDFSEGQSAFEPYEMAGDAFCSTVAQLAYGAWAEPGDDPADYEEDKNTP